MKRVVISGYFNPLHGGHLDLIEAARRLGDYLIVIVNNDVQAIQKKGKVILDEQNRLRLVSALRDVDEVILSIDQELPVSNSLKMVAEKYRDDKIIFANGGDRDSERVIPESSICQEFNIDMHFGVGSHDVVKRDSSTRINRALGHAQ